MDGTSKTAKIIVGVDGSEESLEALRHAARLAQTSEVALEVLACWEYPRMYTGFVAAGVEGFAEAAEKVLQDSVTKTLGAERPAFVSTKLIHGPAPLTLINASSDASMLVLGRRGHGGFGGLLVGSVSSACVAHAHCPVLVVHTERKQN
ncbi:MAG: universal stress protein [Actinomycetota bacterium]|nr:universal stress protein [Actinomycetota bacterium]